MTHLARRPSEVVASASPAPVQVLGVDEQHGAATERLRACYRLGERDAAVARPDGYVASRCDRTRDPGPALHAAVTLTLGLPLARDMAA